MVWENQTTGWLARKWEDPCQAQARSRRGADHCHHLDESGVESDGENDVESGGESDVESDGERDEKRVRGVDQCQLHGDDVDGDRDVRERGHSHHLDHLRQLHYRPPYLQALL